MGGRSTGGRRCGFRGHDPYALQGHKTIAGGNAPGKRDNLSPTLEGARLPGALPPAWSFYICEKVRRIFRRMAVVHPQPSPPWGRGWRATGVLISRGATGEGVKTVNPTKTTGTIQLRRVHRERRDRETDGIGRSGTAFTARPPMNPRPQRAQRRLIVEEGRVGTPSPGPPRLEKAPVADHPLPKGGEG
jgi:hypothetical protein